METVLSNDESLREVYLQQMKMDAALRVLAQLEFVAVVGEGSLLSKIAGRSLAHGPMAGKL